MTDDRRDDDDAASPKDAARKVVLARRARFIAAAVAGVGIACEGRPPEPCLSPMPLEIPPLPPTEAGAAETAPEGGRQAPGDAGPTSEPPAETDAGPPIPVPCLSIKRPTDAGASRPMSTAPTARPIPCLSPPPPKMPRKQ